MCERLYMMIDMAEVLNVQLNWLQSDLFFYWKHCDILASTQMFLQPIV